MGGQRTRRTSPTPAFLNREARTPRPPVAPAKVVSAPSISATPRQPSVGPQVPTTPQHASSTPRGKREASGASQPLEVRATGAGGVEELARHLDSSAVSWALLRFQVGSGTFARMKLVVVHCNGADAPVMLRGWLKERVHEVVPLFGDVHANVVVARPQELTVEFLCERLLPLFAADNIEYSLQALRADYGKTVAQMQEEAAELERQRLDEEPRTAKESEGPVVTREEALLGCGEDCTSYNWVLLEPARLQLHNAGYGGLEEMKKWLPNDKVLFGVLRLSFGCSFRQGGTGLRATKHIFVHWVGSAVGAVRRGRWNAKLNEAAALISSNFSVAFRREAHSVADLRLEDLAGELRRLTVVDGSAAKDGMTVGRVSAEGYLSALAEEVRERKALLQAKAELRGRKEDLRRPSTEGPGGVLQEVQSVVEVVRAPCGQWNWVLCGWPKQAAPLVQLASPKAVAPAAIPGAPPGLPFLLGATPSPYRRQMRSPKVSATPVPAET